MRLERELFQTAARFPEKNPNEYLTDIPDDGPYGFLRGSRTGMETWQPLLKVLGVSSPDDLLFPEGQDGRIEAIKYYAEQLKGSPWNSVRDAVRLQRCRHAMPDLIRYLLDNYESFDSELTIKAAALSQHYMNSLWYVDSTPKGAAALQQSLNLHRDLMACLFRFNKIPDAQRHLAIMQHSTFEPDTMEWWCSPPQVRVRHGN